MSSCASRVTGDVVRVMIAALMWICRTCQTQHKHSQMTTCMAPFAPPPPVHTPSTHLASERQLWVGNSKPSAP